MMMLCVVNHQMSQFVVYLRLNTVNLPQRDFLGTEAEMML